MGISGISPLSLLLILAIVLVLFGTKRIRTLGRDLGNAIRGFKEGVEGKNNSEDNNHKKED